MSCLDFSLWPKWRTFPKRPLIWFCTTLLPMFAEALADFDLKDWMSTAVWDLFMTILISIAQQHTTKRSADVFWGSPSFMFLRPDCCSTITQHHGSHVSKRDYARTEQGTFSADKKTEISSVGVDSHIFGSSKFVIRQKSVCNGRENRNPSRSDIFMWICRLISALICCWWINQRVTNKNSSPENDLSRFSRSFRRSSKCNAYFSPWRHDIISMIFFSEFPFVFHGKLTFSLLDNYCTLT